MIRPNKRLGVTVDDERHDGQSLNVLHETCSRYR